MNSISSYNRSLKERGYEVTPDQRAAHRHILEGVIPVRKSLAELLDNLCRLGALDRDEAATVRDAISLLDGLCIPMTLLNVLEDPHEAAASRMFSRMLRGRGDDDGAANEAPGMRR